MPELLRPDPPRSWLERLAAARAAVDPARLAVTAGVLLLLTAGGWWLLRPARAPVEDALPRAAPGAVAGPPAAAAGALPSPPSVEPSFSAARWRSTSASSASRLWGSPTKG